MTAPGPVLAELVKRGNGDLIEVWTCFGVCCFVCFLRFVVRIRVEGAQGLRADDWLCIPYLALWCVNAIVVGLTYHTGSNLILMPQLVSSLSDEDIAWLTRTARIQFIDWYAFPAALWTLKFTILAFYRRLTLSAWHAKTMKALYWFCGLTITALLLTITCICLPFHQNWQIRPFAGRDCTAHDKNFWVMFAFNISTDLAILIIPISMLTHFRAPLGRKIVVALLLCSGIFMITTTIIRGVSTASNTITFALYVTWASRELTVGFLAVSAPVLGPLFALSFWTPGPYVRGRSQNQVELYDVDANGRTPPGGGQQGSQGEFAHADLKGTPRKKPAMSWNSRAMRSIMERTMERTTVAEKELAPMPEYGEGEDRSTRSSRSSTALAPRGASHHRTQDMV